MVARWLMIMYPGLLWSRIAIGAGRDVVRRGGRLRRYGGRKIICLAHHNCRRPRLSRAPIFSPARPSSADDRRRIAPLAPASTTAVAADQPPAVIYAQPALVSLPGARFTFMAAS